MRSEDIFLDAKLPDGKYKNDLAVAELDKIEKKIHYLLSKRGILEPNVDDYKPIEMRHYYAAKKRYKHEFDLYHAEFAAGRIEI